jgi:hypothetical protein
VSNEQDATATPAASVAETILHTFLTELAKEDGLADVAVRLRKVILEDGISTEPAIRSALFPDSP